MAAGGGVDIGADGKTQKAMIVRSCLCHDDDIKYSVVRTEYKYLSLLFELHVLL